MKGSSATDFIRQCHLCSSLPLALRASASLAAGLLNKCSASRGGAFRRARSRPHTGRFVLALDLAASGLRELPRENKPLARAARQAAPNALHSERLGGRRRSLDPHDPPADVPRHLAAVRGYSGRTCREARSRRGLGPITSIPQKEFSLIRHDEREATRAGRSVRHPLRKEQDQAADERSVAPTHRILPTKRRVSTTPSRMGSYTEAARPPGPSLRRPRPFPWARPPTRRGAR